VQTRLARGNCGRLLGELASLLCSEPEPKLRVARTRVMDQDRAVLPLVRRGRLCSRSGYVHRALQGPTDSNFSFFIA
jgi:hypothetical protein